MCSVSACYSLPLVARLSPALAALDAGHSGWRNIRATTHINSEAILNLMRSTKCFECPSCLNTLSIVWGASESLFYLECNFCRWDSLSVPISASKPETLCGGSPYDSCSRMTVTSCMHNLRLLIPTLWHLGSSSHRRHIER